MVSYRPSVRIFALPELVALVITMIAIFQSVRCIKKYITANKFCVLERHALKCKTHIKLITVQQWPAAIDGLPVAN